MLRGPVTLLHRSPQPALRAHLLQLRSPQKYDWGVVNTMRLGGLAVILALLLGAVPALAQDSSGIHAEACAAA